MGKDQENEIHNILDRDECNTYVMSCYINRDELYKQMRNDIKILCDFIKGLS